ncbi:MAG TPA: trimeric intracellular cation channel family protein [Geminicoccus sp.]|uniref:trimeric intracellular cation channel family protein n=1 Tax=Geminicoccus sp. TaxID=2024832 RepID=UPI002E34271B|nr:trimeric intracellular cation channel family protein [Geminicoccus sp.]HEX2526194.1 trimeric intracellular cation channel family protein [Geminicoccus sp.]
MPVDLAQFPDLVSSVQILATVLNLTGTFMFAVSGAVLGVRRRLDLFGVLVLAFVTAVSGGILRDLLIGDVPPDAIRSWHSLAVAAAAGVLAFYASALIETLRNPVQLFDAIGLGIFAVSGTAKALAFGVHPVMAAVLGMVSGIGGGMLRDILAGRTPIVLHSDIYATAALAGGALVVAGHALDVPVTASMLAGIATCVFLRAMAIYRHWSLPRAGRTRPHDP